jgi:hypothetical protein
MKERSDDRDEEGEEAYAVGWDWISFITFDADVGSDGGMASVPARDAFARADAADVEEAAADPPVNARRNCDGKI